jgi:hypothetical protein
MMNQIPVKIPDKQSIANINSIRMLSEGQFIWICIIIILSRIVRTGPNHIQDFTIPTAAIWAQ